MFDFVKNRRVVIWVILVLVSIPFAFFGVDWYFRGADVTAEVATVAGSPISIREYTDALQRQQDYLRRVMGAQVDSKLLDSAEVRERVLDQLIAERVQFAAAAASGLTVTNAELRAIISSEPQFREDGGAGKFSPALYQSALRSAGMSEQTYEATLRRNIMVGRVQQNLTATAFLPSTVADRLYRLRAQQREVSQIVLSPGEFAPKIRVEPEAAKAFYDAHKDEFKLPEKVRVEYVILSQEGIEKQVEITPEKVKEYYEEHRSEYQTAEERRASHILISVPAGATPEQKAEAGRRAESLLAQARKTPKAFAELAKKNSEDPGSAAEGGDLGFFPRGRMANPFEETVFAMKVGEVAGPVETQFGYHIIRLDAIKDPAGPKLEAVKTEIEDRLRRAEAGRRFAEAAENFSNIVYEQPDSLEPAAEAYKLQIQTSGWITRAGSGETVLLNNERFLSALFAADSLKDRRNTEAVEIAPNVLVSARIIEHQPAVERPFDEVRPEIIGRLTQEKTTELARKEGEALLARLKKGEQVARTWSPARLVARERREGLHPDGLQAVFGADASKLPAYAGVPVPDGRFVIYRISRLVEVQTVDAEARKMLAGQVARVSGMESNEARLESLKRRSNVQINRKAIERPS
jgi:peptidyl-prolyl cis-trans isomerase D